VAALTILLSVRLSAAIDRLWPIALKTSLAQRRPLCSGDVFQLGQVVYRHLVPSKCSNGTDVSAFRSLWAPSYKA
jgi:hypothetical protein